MQVRLRSSSIATADNCRRMLQYQYILKVESSTVAANLVFGRCIDVAIREYLRALTLGEPLIAPVTQFQELWHQARAENVLVFSKTQNHATFERIGIALMRVFPEFWDAVGFQVALSARGDPLLDVPLSTYLGRLLDFEVYLDGTLDILAYAEDGELAILDVKTAASAHTTRYTQRSDQLTTYQILVASNLERLGLPPVRRLGFLDLLKRRASARINPPLLVPPRSPAEIAEFILKCFWLAEDIKRQRFPRASRMQFNTPCELCAFAQHCIHGNSAGLVFPADAVKRIA